jgi:predicted RNase H-like nuclease (RuvC/YqgF family)
MDRKSISMLFCIIGLYLLTPQRACAQSLTASAANKSSQEQIVRDILSEARELRAEVQRLKSSMYQTQVVIQRLRLQQEQIARLTAEISQVREKISEAQAGQAKLEAPLEETKKQVDAGVITPSELKRISGEIEELKRREQRLTEQEAQLSADLITESARLTTLNKQLDELGQEAAGVEKK